MFLDMSNWKSDVKDNLFLDSVFGTGRTPFFKQ